MPLDQLFFYVARGFLITLCFELPVLLLALSKRYTWKEKLIAGLWMNASSYPVVSFVIPYFVDPYENRLLYLLIAESAAPLIECLLFWFGLARRREGGKFQTMQDMGAIILANALSFCIPEFILYKYNVLN